MTRLSCLPLTTCFGNFKKEADVNNDGKVDFKDLEASANAIATFLKIDPEKAKAKLAEFARKIDKLQAYLTAAKVIFAKDQSTIQAIDIALTALTVIEVTVDMVKDLGGKVEAFTPPKDINEVGKTISDLQDTNISMQSYAAKYAEVLKIGFDSAGFDAISAALAKVAAAQKMWVDLGSARVLDIPAETPATAPTPALAAT